MKKLLYFPLAVILFSSLSMAQENGCLNAVNGQYPSNVYQPLCKGISESIVTSAWAGEYSKVQLIEGVEYQFSSSIPTDFLTISDENGQNVLTYGTTPLTYTADSNRIIRFYTHADSDCTADQEDRSRIIKCGDPADDPGFDYMCSQNYNYGKISYSSSIEANHGMTANDFFVMRDLFRFFVVSVKLKLYTMAGSENDFTTFDVHLLNDDGGIPGTEIFSKTAITDFEVENTGDLYMGHMVYNVTINIDSTNLEGSMEEATRYWISIQAHSLSNSDIFWVLYPYTEGWTTLPTVNSTDGGQTWTKVTRYGTGDHYDGFMELENDCWMLDTDDIEKKEFNFYPNPVTAQLSINSEKNIRQLTVTNAAGQKVLTLSDNNIQIVDMSRFVPGTYFVRALLEDGRIETFKIVKK